MTDFTLQELAAVIHERASASGETSYTKSLLDAGIAQCARKLGEEATETIIAALSGNPDDLRSEAADLVYHLLVVLEASGVTLNEVLGELGSRTGRSGIEEKAARSKS